MSPVLVDTSVWRSYFAGRIASAEGRTLEALLDEDAELLLHPAVIGELVLGGLSQREEVLLKRLPPSPEVSSTELLAFIHHHQLPRRGIGWVDCQLLASARLAGALLWSFDRALNQGAAALQILYPIPEAEPFEPSPR